MSLFTHLATRQSIVVNCGSYTEKLHLTKSSHIHDWNADGMTLPISTTDEPPIYMALSFDVISTESLLTLGFVAVMFVATTPNAREYNIIPRDMNDSDKHDVTELRSRTHTSD
jgi:hypothetical protein